MLHKNVVSNNQKVISLFEIFTLFIIFLVILLFLYPKGSLEKQVLAEKKNYDLTAIYLNNLIKLNPDDTYLVYMLAKTLFEQKEYPLAINLVKILEKDPYQNIGIRASILHIKINQALLEKERNKFQIEAINNKNRNLINNILNHNNFDFDINSSKILYYTASSLGDKETALIFNNLILEKPYKNKQERLFWLKNSHYLADELSKKTQDITAIKSLVKEDPENKIKWLNTLCEHLDEQTDVTALAKDLELKNELEAYFYILNKKYDESAALYLSIYKKEDDFEKKKKLLFNIIKNFKLHNQVNKAAEIVKSCEDDYINHPKIINKILKLYFTANRVDLAQNLSLKILKKDK